MVTNKRLIKQLSHFETLLRSAIEDNLGRLFTFSKTSEIELEKSILEVMENGCKTMQNGQMVAPNSYIIYIHPKMRRSSYLSDSALAELENKLEMIASRARWTFLERLSIQVNEDEEVAKDNFIIKAQIHLSQLAKTTNISSNGAQDDSDFPRDAFLIINGVEVFPLNQTVINIGRRPDNHLVIDDPRISRAHAQIRAIKGRFVIFDLDSTGGTSVNNQLIHQCVLFPGDVILLAGFPLIYGQNEQVDGGTNRHTNITDKSNQMGGL